MLESSFIGGAVVFYGNGWYQSNEHIFRNRLCQGCFASEDMA